MKTTQVLTTARPAAQRSGFWQVVVKDFRRNKYIYAMLLPVVAYYLIFHYIPMYGAQIQTSCQAGGMVGFPSVAASVSRSARLGSSKLESEFK